MDICPNCGQKRRTGEKYCWCCGYSQPTLMRSADAKTLESFYFGAKNKVLRVNGEILENVTAFSFICKDGEYSLNISMEKPYATIAQTGSGKAALQ